MTIKDLTAIELWVLQRTGYFVRKEDKYFDLGKNGIVKNDASYAEMEFFKLIEESYAMLHMAQSDRRLTQTTGDASYYKETMEFLSIKEKS